MLAPASKPALSYVPLPAALRIPRRTLTGKTRQLPRPNNGGGSALPALPFFRENYHFNQKVGTLFD